MILQEDRIIKDANRFCESIGLETLQVIDDIEVYFIEHEVIIVKPQRVSKYDGLYGDADTKPIPLLVYSEDQDKFTTTEHTHRFLRKKAS